MDGLYGLCPGRKCSPSGAQNNAARRSDLRHHSPQTLQDWGSGHHQCSPHQNSLCHGRAPINTSSLTPIRRLPPKTLPKKYRFYNPGNPAALFCHRQTRPKSAQKTKMASFFISERHQKNVAGSHEPKIRGISKNYPSPHHAVRNAG